MFLRVLILAMFLGIPAYVLAAGAGDASAQMPRTRLDAFVTAFNTGEENAWREFIVTHWQRPPADRDSATTAARRLGLFQMLYGDLGPLRVHAVEAVSDSHIVAIAQGMRPRGSTEWIRMRLFLSVAPPNLLIGVGVRPTHDPTVALPTGEITDDGVRQYLDSYVSRLVDRDAFSGAVLVAKNDIPVYTFVSGLACRRYGTPNQIDTKFNLGSMNKMFTGVAIAQLAEQGKLSFDDKVGTYLPDYPNADVRDRVTIRHLLTHTAGLGDYWDALFSGSFWKVRSVRDYAALFAADTLLFEPGERFSYSNAGPIVLGLIIEKISGLDYHEYIRKHVTGPAGMRNTDCYEIDRPVENLAVGYTRFNLDGEIDADWRSNLFLHAVRGGPAGGGYSTVEDLLAFANALRSGAILGKALVDTVVTGHVTRFGDQKYGFLFGDRTVNGHRIVGHNGGAPGINAVLEIYWDEPYTVAVLGNQDDSAEPVAGEIRRLLTGTED